MSTAGEVGPGTGAGWERQCQVPLANVPGRWERFWSPFWALPVAIVVASIAVGLVLPSVDEALAGQVPYVFQAGPDGARSLLGTIATAMISVTGLVFSITMVVLQLASSQFSPRVLGNFLSSRMTQVTLGLFTASFVYSLTVLRVIRGSLEDYTAFVPQVSVTLAFVLVLAAVGCFLAFINHIVTSVQVSTVVSDVAEQTHALVEEIYPLDEGSVRTWTRPAGVASTKVVATSRHGHVQQIEYARLVERAAERDVVVELLVPVGAFVVEGQPVARVWGGSPPSAEDLQRLGRCVELGGDRTMNQELEYGLRQLVDIADRALSPGVNDPTTAVQVINELHRVCRALVQRVTPAAAVTDDDGVIRLVHVPQPVSGLLELACAEIAHYGTDSPRVIARLLEMIDDLLEVTHEDHRAVLLDLRATVAASEESD